MKPKWLGNRITQADKTAMTKLLLNIDTVNKSSIKYILDIEEQLLAKNRSLYPLAIIVCVSTHYQVSVSDILGKTRMDEKARRARKIIFYLIDHKTAGIVNRVDIARIMNRGQSSSSISYAVASVSDCLLGNCGGIKDDIAKINDRLCASGFN